MSDWQRKLNIKDAWDASANGDMSSQELAGVIAKRLRKLKPFVGDRIDNDLAEYLDNKRDEIAEEFEAIAEDSDSDTKDFDYVMDELYDWGDEMIGDGSVGFSRTKKACWVATSF